MALENLHSPCFLLICSLKTLQSSHRHNYYVQRWNFNSLLSFLSLWWESALPSCLHFCRPSQKVSSQLMPHSRKRSKNCRKIQANLLPVRLLHYSPRQLKWQSRQDMEDFSSLWMSLANSSNMQLFILKMRTFSCYNISQKQPPEATFLLYLSPSSILR